jgi:hypothetical protein
MLPCVSSIFCRNMRGAKGHGRGNPLSPRQPPRPSGRRLVAELGGGALVGEPVWGTGNQASRRRPLHGCPKTVGERGGKPCHYYTTEHLRRLVYSSDTPCVARESGGLSARLRVMVGSRFIEGPPLAWQESLGGSQPCPLRDPVWATGNHASPVTKIHFCNFIKIPPTPLDIIQALWHNKPVADNDEK